MNIRRAEDKDSKKVIDLLQQVLEIHAALRPDLFFSGTTKYTEEEVQEIFADDERPVYVAVDENDEVLGYVFCQIGFHEKTNNGPEYRFIYIDDLCVDEKARGQHVGEALFEHVKKVARDMGCYEVNLHVWEGNDARIFYERMGMIPQQTTMEYIL